MKSATQVQIVNEVFYISLQTNAIGKTLNPSFLPPAMSKY